MSELRQVNDWVDECIKKSVSGLVSESVSEWINELFVDWLAKGKIEINKDVTIYIFSLHVQLLVFSSIKLFV